MGVSPAASPLKSKRNPARLCPRRAPRRARWVGSRIFLRTGADASPYLTIRLLALQSLVGIDLTSTKLDDAASRAEAMRTMVEAPADRPQNRRGGGRRGGADAALARAGGGGGVRAAAAERGKVGARDARLGVCGALSELADGSPEAIGCALNLVRPVLAARQRAAEEAAAAGGGKEKDKDTRPTTRPRAALFVSGYATLRQRGVAGGQAQAQSRPEARAQPVLQPPARGAVAEPHRHHRAGGARGRPEPVAGHAAELC